jgi:hypothetical protein
MKVRRKAVVLDAIQWKGDNYSDVHKWLMAFGGGLGDPGIEMQAGDDLYVRDRDKDFKQFYDSVHSEYIEPNGPPATFQYCNGCGHNLDQCDCET